MTVEINRFTKQSNIDIFNICANPWQPRMVFDPVKIAELAEDIRAHGLIQPIVVRIIHPNPDNKGEVMYQIAAGERRWRAYQMLYNGYKLSGKAVEDKDGNLVPDLSAAD